MSWQAVRWVFDWVPEIIERDGLEVKAGSLHTLAALAHHADADGTNAFPSVPTMARKTQRSVRVVQQDLRALTKLDFIRHDPNPNCAAWRQLPRNHRPPCYLLVYSAEYRRFLRDEQRGKPRDQRKDYLRVV